jgi:hypothetical protein
MPETAEKKIKTHFCYKDQPADGIYESNHCLYLQQIEICKYCLGEKYVPGY